MRREVPFIIMIVFALFRIGCEVLYSLDAYRLASGDLLRNAMGMAINYMACGYMFLGIINLTRVQGNNIRRRRTNWLFSVWCLFCMAAYVTYGILKTQNDPIYQWVYNSVFRTLDATMFSMLAFYIASAAYRAFRVRSMESALLLVVATLVMLANVPLGEAIWPGFVTIKDWILRVPNAAGVRAVNLGIFLGAMATNIRVFLGIERRHLGQD